MTKYPNYPCPPCQCLNPETLSAEALRDIFKGLYKEYRRRGAARSDMGATCDDADAEYRAEKSE